VTGAGLEALLRRVAGLLAATREAAALEGTP
jgi:hypothetical protein